MMPKGLRWGPSASSSRGPRTLPRSSRTCGAGWDGWMSSSTNQACIWSMAVQACATEPARSTLSCKSSGRYGRLIFLGLSPYRKVWSRRCGCKARVAWPMSPALRLSLRRWRWCARISFRRGRLKAMTRVFAQEPAVTDLLVNSADPGLSAHALARSAPQRGGMCGDHGLVGDAGRRRPDRAVLSRQEAGPLATPVQECDIAFGSWGWLKG